MKQSLQKYRHAWLLLYFAIYLPWFFLLEETVTTDYYVIHTDLDDRIPFNEYFIIPYVMWFFYIAATMTYFFFKDKSSFYRYCIYLFTGMTISLLICTVFHNGTDLRPMVNPAKNLCSRLVAALHKVDTSTNIFPSIHVFNSLATHAAIVKSPTLGRHRFIRLASLVLAVAICLSTVFLKQHSVVDVFGGILLAYALYPLAYGSAYAAQKRVVRKTAV